MLELQVVMTGATVLYDVVSWISFCQGYADQVSAESEACAGVWSQNAQKNVVTRKAFNAIRKRGFSRTNWVSSERMIADSLTKVSSRQTIVEQISGMICIQHDPNFQEAKKVLNEPRRQRRRWQPSPDNFAGPGHRV